MELNASEDQFNTPFIYGSARDNHMKYELEDESTNLDPLFETIVKHIPAPDADPKGPFRMLISNLDWDDYVGRIAIGKITSGKVAHGDSIVCIHRDGTRERAKVTRLQHFSGLGKAESATAPPRATSSARRCATTKTAHPSPASTSTRPLSGCSSASTTARWPAN